MTNTSGIKRDFFFLILLILMVKIAITRQKNMTGHGMISTSAQLDALPDMLVQVPNEISSSELLDAKKIVDTQSSDATESFIIHEASHDVLQQIEMAQTHIKTLLTIVKPATKRAAQLHSMHQRLVQLKKEYKSTSPAIALLGPIGTTGIVLKENELEKNLLRMINITRSILQTYLQNTQEQPPYRSISQGLEHNASLIALLNTNDHTA